MRLFIDVLSQIWLLIEVLSQLMLLVQVTGVEVGGRGGLITDQFELLPKMGQNSSLAL
jgi:hypothetical protein